MCCLDTFLFAPTSCRICYVQLMLLVSCWRHGCILMRWEGLELSSFRVCSKSSVKLPNFSHCMYLMYFYD